MGKEVNNRQVAHLDEPPLDVIGINALESPTGKAVPTAPRRGRQKGSRNKVTILKLMAEQAVRENNATKILEVCNLIVDQALEGDKASQKLVWQSVVSNGLPEESKGTEKVEIRIGATAEPTEVTINQEVIDHEQGE